jgi:hypothetical protein
VARNIHSRGPRASHVFAPVNCAGLPETLSNPSSSATSRAASPAPTATSRQARDGPHGHRSSSTKSAR